MANHANRSPFTERHPPPDKVLEDRIAQELINDCKDLMDLIDDILLELRTTNAYFCFMSQSIHNYYMFEHMGTWLLTSLHIFLYECFIAFSLDSTESEIRN